MKFHENMFIGFQDIELTGFCDRLMDRQEIQFLSSVCRLMMHYFSMKFYENILNGFQVRERTRNDHCQISKGNNSKNILTRYGSCGLHV